MTRKKSRKRGSIGRKTYETKEEKPADRQIRGKSEKHADGNCNYTLKDGNGTTAISAATVITTAASTASTTASTAALVATSGATASTESAAPIDVYARLTYPLVRPCRKDKSLNSYADGAGVLEEKDEEEKEVEDSVELKFSPRRCFAPSLCLVCMERSTTICKVCNMVSYCSSKHRRQDLDRHRDLCQPLAEIHRAAKENSVLPSARHYRVYRAKSLEILQSEIGRPLELWEKEIVLYPRFCRVCGDLSDNLMCCGRCAMEFFCEAHEKQHGRWCQEFRVFRTCLFMQHRHGRVDPVIPSVVEASPLALPENLDRLFYRIFAGSPYYRTMDSYTYAMLSHASTIPLTVLYSMQLACLDWRNRSSFAIHVIGAELQFECVYLEGWERLFVHFLPNLRKLSVSFVGPELRLPDELPVELLGKTKLCAACKSTGKIIKFSFHPQTLYHEFFLSKCSGESPDLVCLFNPGLYRETAFQGQDTWPPTIRQFCKFRVPISVTSYTEEEIPRDVRRIESIAEIETLVAPRRNPFASVKPDRNFLSDDVAPLIYKNYYLAIVRGK